MISSYFIRKKIKACAGSSRQSHRSLSFDQVRSILVLYEARDSEQVKAGLEQLRKARKQVKTCVFLNKGLKPESMDGDFIIREQGDVDVWGMPVKELVRQFDSLDADLLINLGGQDCHLLHYLSLNHPCTFKAGIDYADQDWYELTLSGMGQGDLSFFFDQILFYLRSIRAK